MPKMKWDEVGKRFYRTGVSDVALFVWDPTLNSGAGGYGSGVPWSGVTSIEESPDGGDANDFYADNIKYLSLRAVENYGATITAYQSPSAFDVCDGSESPAVGVKIGQQKRRAFALVWKTQIGNDTEGSDYGYELHIVYNATASPSSKNYETINDSPEPAELSWELTTTPIAVTGYKPTSTLVINSKAVAAAKLSQVENRLYGTDGASGLSPTLLTPDEIIALINAA